MSPSDRKSRERAARELEMVHVADRALRDGGFQRLTMDGVAAEVGVSKGTVYQHFAAKEDLVLGVAEHCMGRRAELFARAAGMSDARPRERMAAIGIADELSCWESPHQYAVEQLIRTASFWEKTAPARRQHLGEIGHRILSTMDGLVHDADAQGDIDLARLDRTADEVSRGLRALSVGTHLILGLQLTPPTTPAADGSSDSGASADRPTVSDAFLRHHRSLRLDQHAYLDGLGWRPTFDEIDWHAVYGRIFTEVFPDARFLA